MIKQIIGGKTKKTVYADMSEGDLTVLSPLLVGKLEFYEKKFEGGTTSSYPAVMNYINFSVGKKISNGVYSSASVRVPHIKQGKSIADVKTLVVGQFDCAYDLDSKCQYCNLIGSNSEVA